MTTINSFKRSGCFGGNSEIRWCFRRTINSYFSHENNFIISLWQEYNKIDKLSVLKSWNKENDIHKLYFIVITKKYTEEQKKLNQLKCINNLIYITRRYRRNCKPCFSSLLNSLNLNKDTFLSLKLDLHVQLEGRCEVISGSQWGWGDCILPIIISNQDFSLNNIHCVYNTILLVSMVSVFSLPVHKK